MFFTVNNNKVATLFSLIVGKNLWKNCFLAFLECDIEGASLHSDF